MALSIHHTTCACCGSAEVAKVLDVRDFSVSGEFFEIWHCKVCSFRFTQNPPGPQNIGVYYQSGDYVSHSDTRKGLVNRLYHAVRSITLKSKVRLVKSVTKLEKGTLLDVGAGTGAFSSAMVRGSWTVTGLEPEEQARKKAADLYGLTLDHPNHLYNIPSSTIDCITLWHVLEHVHDLAGYLEIFKKVLKPQGRLLVAVPNYTSYDASFYGKAWAAYDVPRHLHHFSPFSMNQLLNRHGFEIEKKLPMWFDSFYVSLLSEKYKYHSSSILRAFFIGLYSNLRAFLSTDRCSSIIYIIKIK